MKFTMKRLLLMLLCSLLPLAVFVFCSVSVMRGNLIPLSGFWIIVAVVPAVAVLLIGFAAFANIPPIGKSFLLAGIIAAMIFGGGFIAIFTLNYATCDRYTGQQIQEPYAQVLNDLMPALDTLGETEQVEFYQYREKALFFYHQADVLICNYSEDMYDDHIAALEQRYVFQSESMEACDRFCDPAGRIGDYYFRFLAIDGTYDDIYYPKQVVLIGTNDVTSEVVYIAFDDIDLDYIDSFERFVNYDCGWQHIR